jgi:hypothetical protein
LGNTNRLYVKSIEHCVMKYISVVCRGYYGSNTEVLYVQSIGEYKPVVYGIQWSNT